MGKFERRYYMLNPACELQAFAEARDADNGSKPLHSTSVIAATSVMLSEDAPELGGTKAFVIDVSLPKDQTLSLGIAAVEDMQLWLEALQRCVSEKVNGDDDAGAQFMTSMVDSIHEGTAEQILDKFKETRKTGSAGRSGGMPLRTKSTRRRISAKPRALRSKGMHISLDSLSSSPPSSYASPISVPASPFAKIPFEAWASQEGFGSLAEKFEQAGYDDLDLIAELNDDDLKRMLEDDMGVEKPGHRMKVVVAARKLRKLLLSDKKNAS